MLQFANHNQSEAISQYAREHQLVVVKTYAYAGKSGLTRLRIGQACDN